MLEFHFFPLYLKTQDSYPFLKSPSDLAPHSLNYKNFRVVISLILVTPEIKQNTWLISSVGQMFVKFSELIYMTLDINLLFSLQLSFNPFSHLCFMRKMNTFQPESVKSISMSIVVSAFSSLYWMACPYSCQRAIQEPTQSLFIKTKDTFLICEITRNLGALWGQRNWSQRPNIRTGDDPSTLIT